MQMLQIYIYIATYMQRKLWNIWGTLVAALTA